MMQNQNSLASCEKNSYQSINKPLNLQDNFKIWLATVLILSISLGFIHLGNIREGTRQFINHDDLDFIKPLLSIELRDYWSQWLPNRLNYGFPLRDLTFYLDKYFSESLGLNVFWIANFIYFLISQFIFAAIIRKQFSSSVPLMLAGTLVLYFHPLHIEVIQWLTCRKYLTAAIPIALGTYFFDKWKGQNILPHRLFLMIVLWLTSLACYPTAVLWIFWVLAGFYLADRDKKKYGFYGFFCVLLSVVYLRLVGNSTAEIESGLLQIFSIADRAFYFGYNALGRGFFNLVLPFCLSSYYNENHFLNLIGLGLLSLILVGIYQYFRSLKQHQESMGFFKLSLFWATGGLCILIPISNTILSFSDFMLADRHFFMAIPFFIIAGCYLIKSFSKRASQTVNRKSIYIGLAALMFWLGGAVLSAKKRVPLWQDALILMDDCREREHAAKCYSQVIRSNVFNGRCSSVESQINEASLLYKSIKFSSEFRIEIPFFHAQCIAMDQKLAPREKFERIDNLSVYYGETPEIIFGLTLTFLEAGNLQAALNMAANYYMGPLELGPINATEAIKSIYAGQIAKLCELSPTAQCFDRLKHFYTLHPKINQKLGAVQWGKNMTEMMAKRGGLL